MKQEELEIWEKIIDEVKINIPETAHTWLNNLEPALPLLEKPLKSSHHLKEVSGLYLMKQEKRAREKKPKKPLPR